MLHQFLTTHRDAIITRTREKMTNRPWPLVSTSELENGVPLFLTQLSDTLRAESTITRDPLVGYRRRWDAARAGTPGPRVQRIASRP